jgi:hypothetical protein
MLSRANKDRREGDLRLLSELKHRVPHSSAQTYREYVRRIYALPFSIEIDCGTARFLASWLSAAAAIAAMSVNPSSHPLPRHRHRHRHRRHHHPTTS